MTHLYLCYCYYFRINYYPTGVAANSMLDTAKLYLYCFFKCHLNFSSIARCAVCDHHLLEKPDLHEKWRYKSLKVSPVVRAPAGVLGLHDVEGVDMARFLRGVFGAAMHHLPVDQDYATWAERLMDGLEFEQRRTNFRSFSFGATQYLECKVNLLVYTVKFQIQV